MPHKKLKVWEHAIEVVIEVYEITKKFPKEEIFVLTQQMRKAVISIPSNIAEGCSRKSNLETIQFLYIATASLSELETQIIIADKLGYVSDTEKTLNHLSKIKMMIFGLIKSYKMK